MEKLEKGNRFGRLEITEIVPGHPYTEWNDSGFEDTIKKDSYELRCDCGTVRMIPIEDFKGKRSMRDCGCGTGYMKSPTTLITLQVPVELMARVQSKAKAAGNTASQFIRDCMLAGLEGRIKK